jgi:hypothetical protein
VPGSYKDPGFGWMAGFLAAISFAGLLSLIPLRKVLFLNIYISRKIYSYHCQMSKLHI